MELTGVPLLIVAIVMALSAPAVTLFLWGRARGPRAARGVQRLGLVVLCQVTAVLAIGVIVNDNLALYESWSDLFGTDSTTAAVTPDQPAGATTGGGATTLSPAEHGVTGTPGALPGTGRLRETSLTGAASGVTAKVWVLLPADYDQPATRQRRYPVVEFFPGFPGTPTTWLHALELQRVMDDEVAAGRVKPFIAVLPTMNVAAPRDTECVDVAKGPKVATWLAVDVPQYVAEHTRAATSAADWAVTGYSTGGFCATKLLLQYPRRFHSAAVLSGYFSPSSAAGLDDLFAGNTELRHQNDPMWLLAHGAAPAASVLAVYTDQDPSTYSETRAFLAAVRPPMQADELALTSGGHNTGVWLKVEPQVLQWLSRHVGDAPQS